MDQVHDHMTAAVIKCLPTATLADVQEFLADHRITRILVINRDGDPVGIVSQKDLVNFLLTDTSTRGLEEMYAEEVMSSGLITIRPHASIADAAQKMIQEGISSLVVEDSQLEGIITKADIVTYLGKAGIGTPAGQYMTPNPKTAKPMQSIFSAMDLMARHKVSKVIVIDSENKPLGIITPSDLTFTASMIFLSRLYATGGTSLAPVFPSLQVAARDFMTPRPICVNRNSGLGAAAKLMIRHRISALPVTGDLGRLVGILTKTDLTRAVAHETKELAGQEQRIS
jgi:CBS domain-containing protein